MPGEHRGRRGPSTGELVLNDELDAVLADLPDGELRTFTAAWHRAGNGDGPRDGELDTILRLWRQLPGLARLMHAQTPLQWLADHDPDLTVRLSERLLADGQGTYGLEGFCAAALFSRRVSGQVAQLLDSPVVRGADAQALQYARDLLDGRRDMRFGVQKAPVPQGSWAEQVDQAQQILNLYVCTQELCDALEALLTDDQVDAARRERFAVMLTDAVRCGRRPRLTGNLAEDDDGVERLARMLQRNGFHVITSPRISSGR